MTSNPFDDDYVEPVEEDGDPAPTFDGPDEDIIPDDEPVVRIQWMCTGVQRKGLKRVGKDTHMQPAGSEPSQPTTDTSHAFMAGACIDCGTETIWKKVTL